VAGLRQSLNYASSPDHHVFCESCARTSLEARFAIADHHHFCHRRRIWHLPGQLVLLVSAGSTLAKLDLHNHHNDGLFYVFCSASAGRSGSGKPVAEQHSEEILINMKPKLLPGLALVVLTCTASWAVTPDEFSAEKIQGIWPELWKMGAGEMKAPAIDPLSEQQVITEMAGKWFITSGSFRTDKIFISVETNQQATVSGIKDGKVWEAGGQWQVISNKLVLFVKSGNNLPDFIFRIQGKPYMFDEWKETLMSEMQREKPPVAPAKAGDPDQRVLWQPVQAVNGRLSTTNIFAILDSMDQALVKKDAAMVVAHFASNAVITAAVVEGQRTYTTTNDTSSYRSSLEAGFKSFDDYKLQRKDVIVQISPDGRKATSSSTLVETYRFAGNAERAITQESDAFEVMDGNIRLTKMDSSGKVTIE